MNPEPDESCDFEYQPDECSETESWDADEQPQEQSKAYCSAAQHSIDAARIDIEMAAARRAGVQYLCFWIRNEVQIKSGNFGSFFIEYLPPNAVGMAMSVFGGTANNVIEHIQYIKDCAIRSRMVP